MESCIIHSICIVPEHGQVHRASIIYDMYACFLHIQCSDFFSNILFVISLCDMINMFVHFCFWCVVFCCHYLFVHLIHLTIVSYNICCECSMYMYLKQFSVNYSMFVGLDDVVCLLSFRLLLHLFFCVYILLFVHLIYTLFHLNYSWGCHTKAALLCVCIVCIQLILLIWTM